MSEFNNSAYHRVQNRMRGMWRRQRMNRKVRGNPMFSKCKIQRYLLHVHQASVKLINSNFFVQCLFSDNHERNDGQLVGKTSSFYGHHGSQDFEPKTIALKKEVAPVSNGVAGAKKNIGDPGSSKNVPIQRAKRSEYICIYIYFFFQSISVYDVNLIKFILNMRDYGNSNLCMM